MRESTDLSRRFVLARWLFLRGLALVFAIAFVSAWVQIDVLAGRDGILPIGEYLDAVRRQLGETPWFRLPTLCWIDSSDACLYWHCALGLALSIALFLGCAPRAVIAALWLAYLSLSTAGQDFFAFQWDVLLLETAVFAFIFAPGTWRPGFAREHEPSRVALFLVRWLLFRLMLGSGLVKIASGDRGWADGTALTFHYFTQPIPGPLSWWMHAMPRGFHVASCWIMFAIEVALPFACFGPRAARLAAAAGFTGFMGLIAATGNYGFFNLLTVVLCIPLVDDAVWARILPRRIVESARSVERKPASRAAKVVMASFVALVICMSLSVNARRIARRFDPPQIVQDVEQAIDPLRSMNAYGLFAVMTRERREIVIEGSDDGFEWRAFEFRYKPGAVDRAPPQVAPHMPRVDWQMWFAALGRPRDAPWLQGLCARILEGSAPVKSIFAVDPFPDHPPRLVRATLWDYRFTTREERASGEGWWHRTDEGLYQPPMSLRPQTPFPR